MNKIFIIRVETLMSSTEELFKKVYDRQIHIDD